MLITIETQLTSINEIKSIVNSKNAIKLIIKTYAEMHKMLTEVQLKPLYERYKC